MNDLHENLSGALAAATRAAGLPPGAALVFRPVASPVAVELPPPITATAARRQCSFASGRRAARAALRAAGGPGDAPLGIGADHLPEWPAGWIGSISHTDRVAAAVVAPMAGTSRLVLGMDVEELIEPGLAPDIAAATAPEILRDGGGLPAGLTLAEAATRAFSAKEALYKALFPGTRQFREFSAARVSRLGAGAGIGLTLAEDWGAGWAAGTRIDAIQHVAAGHVVTLLWR